MAPRSRASQSQPKASSSKKRPAVVEDDDEEQEEEEEQEEVGKGGKKVLSEEVLIRIASDIVRLALFHEQKKTGLSRVDINKKVIQEKHKSSSRVFNDVFPIAQKILRKTFGMELFEMRKGGKAADQDEVNTGPAKKKPKKKAAAEDDEEEEQEEEGVGKKKKASQTGNSGVYMLRSILPPDLIERALVVDEEAALKQGGNGSGAVVDFQIGDDAALMGVTWVILALILINGRVLDEHALYSYLSKLGISKTSILPSSSTGTHHTLETFLAWLNQHKYLEKVKKDRSGPSQPAANNDGEGDVATKWEWGPRAEAEIGELKLTEFIADLHLRGGDVPEEESRQERDKRLAKEKKDRDTLRRAVTLAASALGSGLRDR